MIWSKNLLVAGLCGLAERQCLVRVTQGGEQSCKIIAHPICVWMLRAEPLVVDRQRAFHERPRSRKVVLGIKPINEAIEARHHIGMLRVQDFIVDHQRPLVERPRSAKVSLAVKQISEVMEALCRTGMLGAEYRVVRRFRLCIGLIWGRVSRWLFSRSCLPS
jgi:hypothetical protein